MDNPICLLLIDVASGGFIRQVRQNPAAAPFRIVVPETDTEKDLIAVAPQADAILVFRAPVPGPLIRAATSLKLIQKHGVNCNNIDVAAATERGVMVATQELLRSVTVAEQALTLMLACARKTILSHRAVAEATYREMGLEPMRTSQWKFRGNWAGIKGMTELYQSTVGIVGLGDIGMEIAKRCRAFGMEAYYHDVFRQSEELEKTLGVSYLPLSELLTLSDYVVLSLPHTPESEGMIGVDQLARMKTTATLINVGRGPLVDEEALIEALQSKRIAMAGLDVYRMEPLPESSPLRKLPNVVLSPHTGAGSDRYWEIDLPAALENIYRFFQGEMTRGIINQGRQA